MLDHEWVDFISDLHTKLQDSDLLTVEELRLFRDPNDNDTVDTINNFTVGFCQEQEQEFLNYVIKRIVENR